MKNAFLIAGIIAVLLIIIFLTAEKTTEQSGILEGEAPELQTSAHPEFGFSFSYPTEYTAVTHENAPGGDLLFAQSIFNAREYAELNASTVPREAPPSLSVEVYRNPMQISKEEWIRQSEHSNYAQSLTGAISNVTLGGNEYAAYQYDGLYRTDAYVAAQEGYIYIFANMWSDQESKMKADMEDVLETVSWSIPMVPAQTAHGDIVVTSPEANEAVSSPLLIEGRARGTWFFEATFPLTLVDWDGRIIAEGFATAQGEWMTEDFVPFTGELVFTKPEFNPRGSVILQKSNPSGLPQNDDSVEIPITFK